MKIGIAHGGHIPDLEMLSRNEQPGGTVVGEAFTVQVSSLARRTADSAADGTMHASIDGRYC